MKTLLVVATVLALVAGTYFADKATRIKPKTAVPGNTVLKSDDPGPDSPKANLPEP
jgi:hypothetical protein